MTITLVLEITYYLTLDINFSLLFTTLVQITSHTHTNMYNKKLLFCNFLQFFFILDLRA